MNNVSFSKKHQGAGKVKQVEETVEHNEINLLPLEEITNNIGKNIVELQKHYDSKANKELYDAIIFLERVHAKLIEI